MARGRSELEMLLRQLGYDPSDLLRTSRKPVTAYKLFRQKDGGLHPLFVDADTPQAPGRLWIDAEAGELTGGGKVKSKIGPLAYRPGWHAGDLPVATHIGGKSRSGLKAPDYRPDDQVWAEVQMRDMVDWQRIANERAQLSKAGNRIPRTAHITDTVPYGGHYRYKTNPNMTGEWLIGGEMKINRLLDDAEVEDINARAGVADLPRRNRLRGRGRKLGAAGALGGAIPFLAPEESVAQGILEDLPGATQALQEHGSISAPESPFFFHQGQRWGDVGRRLGVGGGMGFNLALPADSASQAFHKLGRGEGLDLLDAADLMAAAAPFGVGGPAFRGLTRRGITALQGLLWEPDDE